MPNRKKVEPDTQIFANAMLGLLACRPNMNEQSLAAYLGVTPGTVTKWIKGKSRPDLRHLCELLLNEKLALGAMERECVIHAWLSAHGASKEDIRLITARAQLNAAMVELNLLRRTAACHKQLEELNRDLLMLISTSRMRNTPDPLMGGARRFIFRVFDEAYQLFGAEHVHRACIFVPDDRDPNFLIISPWENVGGQSREANRCYCGPEPVPPGAQRGVVGTVWHTGKGKCVPDVDEDDDFNEFYDPPRSYRPYKSLAQTLILSPKDGHKMGIFCLDSVSYTFQPHDLALMDLYAARLGWILELLKEHSVTDIPSPRAHPPHPSA